jgi:succinate dehydrogenase hydrophobic anchor subunit
MSKSTNSTLHFSTNAQDTFNHWIRQRITAVFMLPSFLITFYWFQSTINILEFDVYNITSLLAMITTMWNDKPLLVKVYLILFFIVLLIHIGEGIDSIIQDYVHHENTKTLSSIMLRCVQILLAKHVYLLLFL